MNIALEKQFVVRKGAFLAPEDVLLERARLLSIEKKTMTRVVLRHVEFLDVDGEWKEAK